ncbi:HEAT repeat domain-containing protein [Nocardia beijingensis]|uniref:HEAT repeat domain-containing protein n=1 Tax=Nocardia beijingensis TaxID=95162 RepID=UPI0018932A40|nr:HEAT repeat domain-containing protein [Nocardia beijingensis]MBF6465709.1 HEAT repeat domain-containing protein [Nocardia beijingensis]
MRQDEEAAQLRRGAVEETNDVVRGNLIKTLVDRWPEDPQTRALLHDLVHVDGFAHNRTGVVKLLVNQWPDEQTCVELRRVVTTDPERSVMKAAAECLIELRPGDAMSWMHEDVRSQDPGVRRRALWTLRTFWKDHPDTLTAIRDRLTSDSSAEVRYEAIHALEDGADPGTFVLALQAVVDPDAKVRAAAVDALGTYPTVVTTAIAQALYERVTTDDDPNVREAALRTASRRRNSRVLWPNHPEAISGLREYVAADPFAESRRFAVYLLEHFTDDPEVRTLLRGIAERHPDDRERGTMMFKLSASGHDDPETKEMVRRMAVVDPSWEVRAHAVQELDWQDDGPDLELLRDRAVADTHGNVRGAAWEKLALWSDREDIAVLMRRRSADDPDPDLRAQLLVEIVHGAQHAADRTPTVTYLAPRVEQDPDADVRQLAADLVADLTSGEQNIQKREVGTRHRWDSDWY